MVIKPFDRKEVNVKSAIIRIVLVAFLVFVSVELVSPTVFHLETGKLSLRLAPAIPGGELKLGLGPLGELSWGTHYGPLNVEAVFVVGDSAETLPQPEDFGGLTWKLIWAKLLWLLLFGGLFGVVAINGPPRRRIIGAALSIVSTFVVVTILGTVAALTFNPQSLRNPSYRGPIQDAPRIFRLVTEIQEDWDKAQLTFNEVIAGLVRLHEQVTTGAEVPTPPTVKFLLVSDLHNNPLGMAMARELAKSFKVDAVLDAGDFTDRGTAMEADFFVRSSDNGIPYILVAGNHEDEAAIQRVKEASNIRLLENGALTEIRGIRIIGESDPLGGIDDRDPKLAEMSFSEICRKLEREFAKTDALIILVHNPEVGECAARYAEEIELPLVFVSGHDHRQFFERSGTVISVSPGTSGAGGFVHAVEQLYGFALVEFEAKTKTFASACLMLFDGPGELRESSCHF
ncbi:MAG: metallophosphoesterase [Candidatus Colwellbacteria bacterium]|nr:metallophosphoesterase [Candidatus Colwellbacteria bacterium]